MATFSIGEAASSGFRIIRQHPKAVLMWSLAYLVIVLLSQVVMTAALWPDIMGATEEAARYTGPEGPSAADIEAALGMPAHIALLQLIQFPAIMLWGLMLYGAVYRAVLEPENSSRWYMRIGMQEFWLGAIWSVAGMVSFFAVAVAAIPLAILAAILAAVNGGAMPTGAWVVLGLAALPCVALMWWASIRLSLASPMSFTKRTVLLFESWAITRGHALRIFLTEVAAFGWALLAGLAFLAILFAVMVVGAIGFGLYAGIGEAAGVVPNSDIPTYLIVAMMVAALAACALVSIQVTVLCVIIAAPSAAIYRQLRDQPEPAA